MNWHKNANYPLTFLSAWAASYTTKLCYEQGSFMLIRQRDIPLPLSSSFWNWTLILIAYLEAHKSHPTLFIDLYSFYCFAWQINLKMKLMEQLLYNFWIIFLKYIKLFWATTTVKLRFIPWNIIFRKFFKEKLL